jgi:exoribonuclease-2
VTELEVVAFERRGRLGLGALKGGGEKNARLVDDLGETLKVSQDKVLHRFKARIQDADARVVKERLKTLLAELRAQVKDGVDLDLLWDSLEDDRVYKLAQLAELYFGGEITDSHVAALVHALGGEDGDEPPYHFRSKPGGLARTDRETFEKIKARLEAERRRREREHAFRVWFTDAATTTRRDEHAKAMAKVPADLAEHLHVLCEYALGGERAPQAARARRLALDLSLGEPDDALALLERGGALPRDVNELPHRAGVPVNYSKRVAAEAEALSAAPVVLDASTRVDFRGKLTTAIDDISTQDVDDGFSFFEEEGEHVLAIHIAEVAATVPKDSDVDVEAKRRATTVYFPGQTLPMIPPGLMRARLSLDAGADRPVVSYVTRVKRDGSLGRGRFVRGIARVGRRLTYDETRDPPPEWREALARLEPLAARLRASRAAGGALLLELPDLKIDIDPEGEPQVKLIAADTPGHRIVSELMVLYNSELARALRDAALAAAFRSQPEPITPPSIAPDDPLFPVRARRGLPPTLVEVDPGPHRTLGVDCYVQGSSPIRRFGDLLAQRQIVSKLEGAPPAYAKDEVRSLLAELERCEKGARRLESDRDLYWIARWLESRKGEVFAGVVSRSPDNGRGLVYVPALHMELPLGDPDAPGEAPEGALVKVKVRRASPRRRAVSFELVEA